MCQSFDPPSLVDLLPPSSRAPVFDLLAGFPRLRGLSTEDFRRPIRVAISSRIRFLFSFFFFFGEEGANRTTIELDSGHWDGERNLLEDDFWDDRKG